MKNFIIVIFIVILIISTSLTKNSTRELEDKIFNSKEQIKILSDKKELILLEHNYLSSPERLFELKENLIDENLKPLKVKKFILLQKNEKKEIDRIIINKPNLVINNFYESKFNVNLNRLAFIFIVIFIFVILYSSRVIYLSSKTIQNNTYKVNLINRADITDRNGAYISKSVLTSNVGIDPKLVKDKKKLLLKLKYTFPDKNFDEIKKKIYGKKFFYIDKKLTPEKYQKIKLLGEKSIRLEQKITRIYPDKNLFSHVIGQIDDDNNGISGIEKSFDEKLKDGRDKLALSLDKNLQFIIRSELLNAQKIFKNVGGAGILMNINNGEILSLVSVPDFDLNSRKDIKDINYINRATKGVYELGSVFKSFTIAAGLNYGLISAKDMFFNLEKKMKCGERIISEYDEKLPKDLSVEDILVYSSNIGSVKIGEIIGKEKLKEFLKKLGF